MSQLMEQIFGNELILSKILSSLPLKELAKSCVSVNHLWNRVSLNVIESRTDLELVFELYRMGRHHNTGHNSPQRETHLTDGKDLEFVSDCFEQIETKLMDRIANRLDIWPKLVITFFGNFCPHSKRPEKLMSKDSLRRLLSPETQLLNVVSSAGLIGSHIRTKAVAMSSADTPSTSGVASGEPKAREPLIDPIEAQAHVDNCAGISMLVFPKYPNVEIDVFDERNLIPLEKLKSRRDLRCLLVFATTCSENRRPNHFKEFQSINQLKDEYDNRIAIGGIITDEINYLTNNLSTTRKKSRDFYGLAFSGPNVRACSLLIKTKTCEETERKFREFRQNLNFDPNLKTCETIAFLFICTGRGVYTEQYRSSNVEADLFKKVFPDVKVLGVFGQGEYGHNYWPSITREQQLQLNQVLQSDQNIDHELWHFYTSVLVLINLPKK